LRKTAVQKLTTLGKPVPKPVQDWRIKTVSDALRSYLDGHKTRFKQELRDPFEAYWLANDLPISNP
jgi:hypothetical protein